MPAILPIGKYTGIYQWIIILVIVWNDWEVICSFLLPACSYQSHIWNQRNIELSDREGFLHILFAKQHIPHMVNRSLPHCMHHAWNTHGMEARVALTKPDYIRCGTVHYVWLSHTRQVDMHGRWVGN